MTKTNKMTKVELIKFLESKGIKVSPSSQVSRKDLNKIEKILDLPPNELAAKLNANGKMFNTSTNPTSRKKSDYTVIISPGNKSEPIMRIFGKWENSSGEQFRTAIIGMDQKKAKVLIENWERQLKAESLSWLLKMFKSEIESFAKKGKI